MFARLNQATKQWQNKSSFAYFSLNGLIKFNWRLEYSRQSFNSHVQCAPHRLYDWNWLLFVYGWTKRNASISKRKQLQADFREETSAIVSAHSTQLNSLSFRAFFRMIFTWIGWFLFVAIWMSINALGSASQRPKFRAANIILNSCNVSPNKIWFVHQQNKNCPITRRKKTKPNKNRTKNEMKRNEIGQRQN